MNKQGQAALARQRIRALTELLQGQVQRVMGSDPIVRGSFYRYRRRCGKASCRCERGALHGGRAFAVRAGGRSRTLRLSGVDLEELARCVGAYRDLRRVRAEMVRTFRELLRQADKLERLRQISLERLKRRRGSPSL
ncbi:MAG: hypothetical protein HY748_05255 [Elusimicrobia bacterium]|nr:hypothetical protein [Elusimicrobiota bacterium]